MRRLLAGRLLQGLAVIWVVSTLTFALLHLAPGDPFSYQNERRIAPEVIAHWRHVYCLDRPLAAQYVCYLRSVATGDLGYSISRARPVRDILIDYVPHTVELMALGLFFSFLIGIALGVLEARKQGTFADWGARGISLFFYSMPDFWLALMLALIFAYWLPIFPISGIEDVINAPTNNWWERIVDHVRHLVLPVTTLTLMMCAGVARFQRAAMLDTMRLEFVVTARAKGVSESGIANHHVLRNALLPIVTLAGLTIPLLLSGAVLVEIIFSWPGMGFETAMAVSSRDYALVTSSVLVTSALVVTGTIAADLLYALADPRVRAA
ncbi:MAG TPA: ABC transporter permease [Gemmatimonadaceae bacterium]|jgi:peptide/nickel transport system permease protein|nr:ABC transporter permease [Gemmatimonadaceae bacterium]